MKNKKIQALTIAGMLSMILSTTAYANSSWHWITKTTPFDILPYVIILTLFVEYIVIKNGASIKSPFKLAIIICLANLISFLLPYAILLMPSDAGYTFEMSIAYWPKYIVGVGYLLLTLIAEIPVVYLSFKKVVTNRKKLLVSIVAANIVTTIMVVAVERLFCKGSW